MPQSQDPFAQLDVASSQDSTTSLAGRSSSSSLAGRSSATATRGSGRTQRRKPSTARYATAATKNVTTPIASDPFADFSDVQQDQPKKKKKGKGNIAFTPNKKVKNKNNDSLAEKDGIFKRVKQYFKMSSPRTIYLDILAWLASHPYVILLIAVLFIAIGMLFGRYYSFGAAFALAVIGALMSRENFDTASYFCYGAAFADFLIPYMI